MLLINRRASNGEGSREEVMDVPMEIQDDRSYTHRTFEGLQLSEHAIRRAEFEQVVFKDCRFAGVTWVGCQLSNCRFVDCELTTVKLGGSTFNEVRFERCRMMGINFADLARVILDVGFRECLMDYACFAGLQLARTEFIDCRLRDADFSNAQLERTVFGGSDLAGANFNHAALLRADLRGAKNLSFDPTLVRLGRTRVDLDALVAIGAQLGLDVGMS